MRRLIVALVLAFAAALWISRAWAPEPLEERLVAVQLAAVMPQQAEVLRQEPFGIQQILLEFAQTDEVLATKARLALLRHGDMSRGVLLAHAAEPEFRAVLREYGEQVIPPIHFFTHNDLPSLAFYKRAGEATEALRQRWGGQEVSPSLPLTEADRGRFAIRFIESDGHGFLGQFVIAEDGSVARVQTERVTEGVVDFFTSGIRGLETRMRQGETVRASDAGWAAVDVAIGVSALKLLRMGRGAAATRSVATAQPATAALGSTLLRGSRIGLQVARIGGPVAVAYIVVRHPSLLNSAFGQIAEVLGYPAWLVQMIGWGLVLLPLLLVLQWLLRPVAFVLGRCGAFLQWCDRRLTGRRRACVTY